MPETDRIPLDRRIADLKPFVEAADGRTTFPLPGDLDAAHLIDGVLSHNLDHTGDHVVVVTERTREAYAAWQAELAATAPAPRRRIALEEVVTLLASVCDGARKRDRAGYGKTTVTDGHRLDAMLTAGIPWGDPEIATAMRLVEHHARQAAELMTRDREKRGRLEAVFRGADRMPTGQPGGPGPGDFRYAGLSPERTSVWLYAPFDARLLDRIRADLRGLAHGERRIANPFFNDQAVSTWNGVQATRPRWEIPYNGTTRERLLAIIDEFGFAVDREIGVGIDKEFDDLMRRERVAWLAELDMFGRKRTPVVCFDTYVRVDAFVQAVTAAVPARMRDYDDGVWFVLADDRTRPAVAGLVERFGIEPDADLAAFIGGGPKAGPGGGPGYGRR